MINSFFIQQSGVSGWHQIGTGNHIPWYNTGSRGDFFLAESGDFLGLNTNRPQSTFHIVQEGGGGAVMTLQSTGTGEGVQDHVSGTFNAYISFSDVSGAGGQVGFNESGSSNLNVENRTSGSINLSAHSFLEKQFTLTQNGNVGIYNTLPNAKLHVVQSGSGLSGLNDDLIIFQKTGIDSTNAPEFIVKNDGKMGLNVYNPKHTLHVSEDKTSKILREAEIKSGLGTIFTDSYIYGYENDYLSGTQNDDINIDFNGKSFRRISLTGVETRIHITTINGSEEPDELKSVSVLLEAPSGERQLEFYPGIRWLGHPPSGLLSGNSAIISFNSFGPEADNTVAVYRAEGDTQPGAPGAPGAGYQGEAGEEFRNKIIGGMFDMNPWQRGTYFGSPISGQYTADRFVYVKTGQAEFDIYKDSKYPPPWSGYYYGRTEQSYPTHNYMKIQCVNTDSGMHTGNTYDAARGEYLEKFNMIEQRVEGYHVRDILPHDFSLTFWSYVSGVSGRLPISIRNKDNDISYVSTYDMCHTGVWSFHSINVPAVTGSLLDSSFSLDADVGLRVGWTLGASSGLNVTNSNSSQWISGYYLGWSGTTSGISMPEVSGCCLKIAGPELKYGWRQGRELSRLRSQQQELELCKRYYERLNFASGDSIGVGQCIGTGFSPFAAEGISLANILLQTFPASSSDPNWNSVTLLIQSETTDGSTTFTDSSSSSHTITAYGDVHHETDRKKWGTTSIQFDGTNDYLKLDAGTDFAYDINESWTIEMWINFTSNDISYIYSMETSNPLLDADDFRLAWFPAGMGGVASDSFILFGGIGSFVQADFTPLLNQWYHIAVVANTTHLKFYIDGTQHGNSATRKAAGHGSHSLHIGAYTANGGIPTSHQSTMMHGYLEDIRITKGVARYPNEFFSTTDKQLINLVQPTSKFGGVKLDYQDKRTIPSISGSGYLETTDMTWLTVPLTETGFEGITETQASVSGLVSTDVFLGGHATTLKPSGDYSFFIDAEL